MLYKYRVFSSFLFAKCSGMAAVFLLNTTVDGVQVTSFVVAVSVAVVLVNGCVRVAFVFTSNP